MTDDIQNKEGIEVSALQITFENLKKICAKATYADECSLVAMPFQTSIYADTTQYTTGSVLNLIIEYENEDNPWRITKKVVQQIKSDENSIIIGDIKIVDAEKIIVVSKLNSIFILPGSETIKNKFVNPNEIIHLTNLISTAAFLIKFEDVADKESNDINLKINYLKIETDTGLK